MGLIPFAGEPVVDMILRALRASNLLSNDASAEAIRNVDWNLDESDRNTLAASLQYGTVGGAGTAVLSSTEDVHIFLDSDDSNPTTPYTNYLRVAKGQNAVPVTDPTHELMTVGSESGGASPPTTILTVGPLPALGATGVSYEAEVHVGVPGPNPGGQDPFGVLGGYGSGFKVEAHQDLFLDAKQNTYIREKGGTVRAGFTSLNSRSRFFLGDSSSDDSILIEKILSSDDYNIETTFNGEATIFIKGSFPNTSTDPRGRVCIGGARGTPGLDPKDLGSLFSSNHSTTCLIVAPDAYDKRSGVHVYHRATGGNIIINQEMFTIDSESDINSPPVYHYFFRVSARIGAARCGIFNVDSNGDANVWGVYNTGGADVAEYFLNEAGVGFTEGDVVVLDVDGRPVKSTTFADPKAVGVVSTKPGMRLKNRDLIGDEDPKVLVALCGTTVVNATASEGAIAIGDLLVSAPGAKAAKATTDPAVGTVIGKALQPLATGEGSIRMLVFQR